MAVAAARELEALWEEKLVAERRRRALAMRKSVWVIGLLVLGALERPLGADSTLVLYLVPGLALVADLFIVRASFRIRRMEVRAGTQFTSRPDGRWDLCVHPGHDTLARFAPLLSTVVVLCAAAALLVRTGTPVRDLDVWAGILLASTLAVHARALLRLAGLDRLLTDRQRELARVAAAAVQQGAGATGTLSVKPPVDRS